MSKVFRLYKEGAQDFKGWNSSPVFPYNSAARATIDDPDGASAKKEITSIPSPFARIDLVKNAFREVCNMASGNGNLNKLDGKTIFHKTVSDTLDVGEIFFNIDKLKGNVEIITWNPIDEIHALDSDGNNSHHILADSLSKYLLADGTTYNFDKLRNIYLLNYVNGPDELNIIGATSPATLFFCGANKLDYVNDIFFQDNDKPFDSDYQPLFKRDHEFIKAWWTLRKTIPNFSTFFPEIDEYLNLTYRAISDNQFKLELQRIGEANISDFSCIDVQENGAVNQVEVLGYQLLKKKAGMRNRQSEFTIKSSKPVDGDAPLVLPIESGNKYADLEYVNGKWGKNNKADIIDNDDIDSRVLPFDGNKYPYLTISDFLEDLIVAVDHKLSNEKYFDGHVNIGKDEAKSFLLPIKPLFFRYFSADDLMSKMPDGKNVFEMEEIAGGSVNVILRVPVIGNNMVKYIEYFRTYYVNRSSDISRSTNDGAVTYLKFAGFVMPGVKFVNERDAYYTVSYISTFDNQAKLQFYKDSNVIQNVAVDCRDDGNRKSDYKTDTYTLKKLNFDFLSVNLQNGKCGILLPKFTMYNGRDTYEFAIDLGTSNTHIEMKKATDSSSVPFTVKEDEEFMANFFKQTQGCIDGNIVGLDLLDEPDIINADYVPAVIGEDSDFCFPSRTAMSCAKIIDWSKTLNVFGLLNFNMTYDKKVEPPYNSEPLLNIKWNDAPNAQTVMKAYIDNLLLLVRNKVVTSGGDLSSTKITWFYPESMSKHRFSMLDGAWNNAFSNLFPSTAHIIAESESVAPIKYYFNRYATATNLVNVDIGGGTTDIAFSDGGVVNYITSFKFAANSLFEDSFSKINPNNGIIDAFKDRFYELLENDGRCNDLKALFLRNNGHPSDMASFLFSLRDNSATQDINPGLIDFNAILQNDGKFKIIFVLFYVAIIYHIAKIMKAKGLGVPRHISFSGNGSKLINIVSPSAKILEEFTRTIFEMVIGLKANSGIGVLGLNESNPKEATCKGGLLLSGVANTPEKVVLKDSYGDFVKDVDTYDSINDRYKTDILGSLSDFFNFALNELPKKYDFVDNLGIAQDSIDVARDNWKSDLGTYLDKGIALSESESGNSKNTVEEALLFYPIKGAIQSLSTKLKDYYESK